MDRVVDAAVAGRAGRRALLACWLLGGLWLASGCASTRTLMPTPNLYATGAAELYPDLPEELRAPSAELVYVTDRAPEPQQDGRLGYGYGRSRSAAWGIARVEIGKDLSWRDLERESLARKRSQRLSLGLASVEERGRFPATPFGRVEVAGGLRLDPAQVSAARRERERLRAELLHRMEEAGHREVVIFVHGYNNDFSYAALTLAELWHYLGREPVPLLYTWPAGRGGPTGYAYDRESGEFTVYHLKQLLRALADFPELERTHIVAHSRGTDVATTALRELFIESRGAGRDFGRDYRIANLVLAAPDLDVEVIGQRLVAEEMSRAIGRITIYTSASDKALGAARSLFGSAVRLGAVSEQDIPAEAVGQLRTVDNLAFVEMQGSSGFLGHGYFHSHAGASSDMVLVIRYGRAPGAEHGRPLTPETAGFWALDDDYPEAASPP